MPSLTTFATSDGGVLVLEADGNVNGPFTIFLNNTADNPHTYAQATAGLRILHRMLIAYSIDLPARALQGECLTAMERKALRQMSYLPLVHMDRMTDKMLKRVASNSTVHPDSLPASNQQNTAAQRLETIASFLRSYATDILSDAIASSDAQRRMNEAYAKTADDLENAVSRTPYGHHNIRSMPSDPYLRIIREIVVNPETLFVTESGKPSSNMLRDRAIALLAVEGVRPGAIGNAARSDFRYVPGDKEGYLVIQDNTSKRGAIPTTGTPVPKGIRSSKSPYNSDIWVKLFPFTLLAIQEYIDKERSAELEKTLSNRSKGMLFLKGGGLPIDHRSTIGTIFRNLGQTLKTRGLLAVAPNDPYVTKSKYDFDAYVLRHSSATFFYDRKQNDPAVLDKMKMRYGWSENSKMPKLYANRALSDSASVNMEEFCDSLLRETAQKRAARSRS